MRLAACSASLVATALLAALCLAETCPINTLGVMGRNVSSSDPSRAISVSEPCQIPGYEGKSEGGASYDLVSGYASVWASRGGKCSSTAWLATHDVFTLVGPEGGAAVEFAAQLEVSACCALYYVAATLREGEANERTTYEPGNDTLVVRIRRSVGESFDLHIALSSYTDGYGFASVHSRLIFAGLPPGYAVVSCQGYVSDPVVPVRPVSWGRIKALYR